MRRYAIIALVLAIATSCEKYGELFTKGTPAPTITASTAIEEQSGVKTTITVDDEGVGTIWWKPGDLVSIFINKTNIKYFSLNTENATTAIFDSNVIIGSMEGSSTVKWGLYPYDANATCDGSSVNTTIPLTQNGVPETFDDNLFPMLAHSTTNEMTFYNVCGGIKFSLSRDDIQTITFKGNNNEDIAGKVSLSMDANGKPVAEITEGEKTITLTPKEGTTFASNTNYYIVMLPTVLSNGFTMTFETEDKIGTFNYTDKAVTISRSKFGKKADIDTFASFEDKPVPATDLSSAGTANCYIVSSAGRYRFKTVQGNSNTSVGDVKGVKVLWESFGINVAPTIGDLIKPDVSYADNYITFSTNDTYTEGNAVIAAYSDANCTDGNVLWSWHIWLTDTPEEQEYYNNAGTMMDRNLGATSAVPGDVHALGLLYQWGRKDPFLNASSIRPSVNFNQEMAESTYNWPVAEKNSDHFDKRTALNYSISHPTVVIYNDRTDDAHDWYSVINNQNNTLWAIEKTIFDPCPKGWRVPSGGNGNYCLNGEDDGVWYNALNKPEGVVQFTYTHSSQKGYNFGYSLGPYSTIWYPLSGALQMTSEREGRIGTVGDYGYELSLLEIRSGLYVIQTFILMSNKLRNSKSRFPIYKTYTQETPKGNLIYPSCCVACIEDDDWHFYNASETCQPVRSRFVNYDNAKENFAARLNIENKRQDIEILSKHSRTYGCALLLFLVAYFIIARSLQLCNEVVILLIVAIILFLLPDILCLVQKVSIKDVEFTINNGME